MARLTKEDWLEEGFKILSEFAQDKLKILYLCERLKVTRGSFYHHFTSMEDYIEKLIDTWEEANTHGFIKVASSVSDPMERMALLSKEVSKARQSIEAAIRSWSFYHEKIRVRLEKVDKIRLTFLEEIFHQLGNDEQTAKMKAKLDYAIIIGLQQLNPHIDQQEIESLFALYWNNLQQQEQNI